jgi:predicted TIM-barrel fold metal-dependent hydrolase
LILAAASSPAHKRPYGKYDAALLELLLDWAPDSKVRKKILADNPAKLYGF